VWKLGAVVACLLFAPVELAAGPMPADLIPQGTGWHCFRSETKQDPRDHASVCVREASVCELHRQRTDDGSNAITQCRPQAKAAVVTYFSVSSDQWTAWATDSLAICEDTRRFLLRDPDVKSVSACRMVGDVVAPVAKLRTAVVPAGDRWFCPDDGGLCSRDAVECNGHGARCAAQPNAFGITFKAYGEYGFVATSSAAACNRLRGQLTQISELSACTAVGAVAPVTPAARVAKQ
jgi:hypothetical protein